MERNVYRRNQLPEPLRSSRYALQRARDRGQILALGHRWYSTPHAQGIEIVAAENGLLVGCLSAAKIWGLWVPHTSEPHFIVGKRAQLPPPSRTLEQATIHRSLYPHIYLGAHEQPAHAPIIIHSLIETIEDIVHFHDAETGLITLESALNQRKIDSATAETIAENAQKSKKRVLHRRINSSQSGSETRLRNFLQSQGIIVEAQAQIPGSGRVDMLVGKSLIIECDSTTFHGKPLNVDADRRRDARQTQLGYTTIRLSYQQIWHDWDLTQEYLMKIIHTKRHHRFPRPL